jgi:hypothetical protein
MFDFNLVENVFKVVSVLLRYKDSDYPFGIFKFFLMVREIKKGQPNVEKYLV